MDSPCANYKETGHVTSLAFLAANSAIRSLYCNLVWMQCPFQLIAGQAAQSDSRIVGRRPCAVAQFAQRQLCQHFCPSVTHMNSVLWTTVKSGFIHVPLVFFFPFHFMPLVQPNCSTTFQSIKLQLSSCTLSIMLNEKADTIGIV